MSDPGPKWADPSTLQPPDNTPSQLRTMRALAPALSCDECGETMRDYRERDGVRSCVLCVAGELSDCEASRQRIVDFAAGVIGDRNLKRELGNEALFRDAGFELGTLEPGDCELLLQACRRNT